MTLNQIKVGKLMKHFIFLTFDRLFSNTIKLRLYGARMQSISSTDFNVMQDQRALCIHHYEFHDHLISKVF